VGEGRKPSPTSIVKPSDLVAREIPLSATRHRRRTLVVSLLALFLASLVAGAGAGVARAATITVNTVQKLQNTLSETCNPGVSPCVQAGDTVSLAAGTYMLTGPLNARVNLTLSGPGTAPGAVLNAASLQADADGSEDTLDTEPGVSVTVTNLSFVNGRDDFYAINALGPLTIQHSTISGNLGAGIFTAAGATIVNTTIHGNATAGITALAPVTIRNSTVTSNGTEGIGNAIAGANVTLVNTVVHGNTLKDCVVPVSSSDHSLDGDGSCDVGALSATNPNLGSLASNGGPTQTRSLPRTSPAVNAGTNANCPSVDQRYVPRDDLLCDIGAFEYVDPNPPAITVPSGIVVPASGPGGAVVNYSVSFTDPDGDAVTGSCTPASGTVFPIGTTTVNCTATDAHNKTATASFLVTVTSSGGRSCRASGKISGHGGSLMARAQTAFATGYRDDVCGKVTDALGDTMSVFNYDTLGGSDLGIAAASCRTDAFAGSEWPYTQTGLGQLNGAPGSFGCALFAALAPPYQPKPGPYPAAGDATRPIMTFPVAGTSVAIGINLQASHCGGTKPASVQLTATMLSRLLSGDITNWSDPDLRAGGLNAGLAACNRAVTRVVRLDAAPTTQTLKHYLVRADNARPTAETCYIGGHWATYAAPAFNAYWPGDAGVFCSPLLTAPLAGDQAQLATCAATPGALCYADLPVMLTQPSLIRASVRNATDTTFALPGTVASANCNLGSLVPPSGGASGAVGLNPTDTWAIDNPGGNHGDLTFTGSAYPICGLTYALVYSGLRSGAPVSRLGFDQTATVWSYFTYILSSVGQSKLGANWLSPLPASVVDSLRQGFQAGM
jgi:ABC-type phosphate transport system substrate-binding protein